MISKRIKTIKVRSCDLCNNHFDIDNKRDIRTITLTYRDLDPIKSSGDIKQFDLCNKCQDVLCDMITKQNIKTMSIDNNVG